MPAQAVGQTQMRLRRIAAHLAGACSETTAAAADAEPSQPPSRVLSDHQIDQFDRDGFLNSGDHLLTEAEVTELSDALDSIIARGPEGFAEEDHAPVSFRSFSGSADPESRPNWQIVNMWGITPRLAAFAWKNTWYLSARVLTASLHAAVSVERSVQSGLHACASPAIRTARRKL